jgi:hypothetical protein
VQALLAGNMGDLVAIPTDVAKLPAAAGSVGFPDAFYPTKNASPITEGAVTAGTRCRTASCRSTRPPIPRS